ncbi:MAG: NADH-quinone oxidoreductase subunit J [bacterium]|nr:NADH-quinone oxidoreductase subunit J [bacterium]
METFTFYIFSLFAVASLWMLLRARQIVHAIAWFAVFLIITAIFFGLLRAPFLALGQLIIFTGGMIAILLIGISFSGMDSQIGELRITNYELRKNHGWYKILSLFFLLTLFISLKLFFAKNALELPASGLAFQLFGTYWPLIAVILLMFLSALLSAVYFLKKED